MNINDFKRKIQEKQAEITKAIHRTLPIKIGRKAADHFQDNFRKGGFAVGPPHPGLAEYFKNQTIIEKAVEWADTHLKEYTLDNNKKAYRLYLHDKEGNTVVIKKDYINETFSKNKRNRKLAKTMSLATMVEEWMPLAKIVRTGDGIHHSCNFLVFEATYLDVTIEAKARDHGAYSILHTMRIKKLENPPERTANAADMSGLTNFSPQN